MGTKYLPSINNKKKSENASTKKANTNELIISSFKPKKLPALKVKDTLVPAVDKNDKKVFEDEPKLRESVMS